MVERYIYSSVFIFGNVKVGPNTKTAFHQQMIEVYGYDIMMPGDKYKHNHAKHCFMCCKKFIDFPHLDKVTDHCHL